MTWFDAGKRVTKMRILSDYRSLDAREKGAAVAIGNFDGIHLGHQSIIELARHHSSARQIPLAVMTFEPHPREFFSPSSPPFRLMNRAARAHRLEQLGVEILYELSFDKSLSRMSSERFVEEILCQGLGLKVAIAGNNFHFGKGRTGSITTLSEQGERQGFEVFVAPMLEINGQAYSSTAVRKSLSEGRPRDAATLLGHWHRIEGKVVHGDKRGRAMLGYPTANLHLKGLHPPRMGIYTVKIDILSGSHQGQYQGVASLGVKPSFGQNPLNLETFIFDFDGDIYGETLSVALIEFQRPEIQFSDIHLLKKQMDIDSQKAKDILAQLD